MQNIEFHLFKKNTEAIATNKGFYYQYLKTVKLWLDNFVNKIDNAIYCEREDDIMQIDKRSKKYTFHQIKCYSTRVGLNDKEVKFSLLNFYRLYLKYDYKGEFYFETNSNFKPRAGQVLKKWYDNQQKGNYDVSDFIDDVREKFVELADNDLKERLKKVTSDTKKKEFEDNVKKFKLQLEEPSFKSFLENIRWVFSQEQDTDVAISNLQKEIYSIISSKELEYDKTVDKKFLFAYILNSVVEKSIEENEEKRLLDNKFLQKILNSTDIQEKMIQQLRPEIIELMKNDFQIIEKLDEVHHDVKNMQNDITEVKELLLQKTRKLPINELTIQVKKWFDVVGYGVENYENMLQSCSELIINIPTRRGYDRVFISCVAEAVEVTHLEKLLEQTKKHKCDEGWIITYRRVSGSVRKKVGNGKYEYTFCYTFDELLDEDIDFSKYFEWVEQEVKSKDIHKKYISLFCQKRVFDKEHYHAIDSSKYKIEKYINQWIDDPSKHHISILGEFGTGKTWFTLHYTWLKLQEYKKAKKLGIKRPRIPVFIPLRDFAKAVNIEGVFSEFFFRKHNSPIKNYEIFVELNKMGKLLLIFDGFDEMADRVDTQKMINNFWELAKSITENSKVILTSRNEHFPENKKSRELLNAEL